MQYDITALGEILIDFTPIGQDDAGDLMLARKAGGAPVNVLATVAKFGGKAAFIGKVGDDILGKFLRRTLLEYGICDKGLQTDRTHNTTLAFVELDENGQRNFSFYRQFGADRFLQPEQIDTELIRQAKLFHFGSLSLTDQPARSATEYALSVAEKAGCVVSYDPNFRAPLWTSEAAAVKMMKRSLKSVDIIKLAEEELAAMYGADESAAVKQLQALGITVILVTRGANGADLYMGEHFYHCPAARVRAIDTTGAGDIFFGTFLSGFIKSGLDINCLPFSKACEFLTTACATAGASVTRRGGISSIPTL